MKTISFHHPLFGFRLISTHLLQSNSYDEHSLYDPALPFHLSASCNCSKSRRTYFFGLGVDSSPVSLSAATHSCFPSFLLLFISRFPSASDTYLKISIILASLIEWMVWSDEPNANEVKSLQVIEIWTPPILFFLLPVTFLQSLNRLHPTFGSPSRISPQHGEQSQSVDLQPSWSPAFGSCSDYAPPRAHLNREKESWILTGHLRLFPGVGVVIHLATLQNGDESGELWGDHGQVRANPLMIHFSPSLWIGENWIVGEEEWELGRPPQDLFCSSRWLLPPPSDEAMKGGACVSSTFIRYQSILGFSINRSFESLEWSSCTHSTRD